MGSFRRIGGLAVAGALLTTVVGGAAAAQSAQNTPEAYVGSAAGQALYLKVGPKEYTGGVTKASADSLMKAASSASGILALPVVGGDGVQDVSVQGTGATKGSATQVCDGGIDDNPLEGILDLGSGCAAALASTVDGRPHGVATAKVLGVDVDLPTATSEAVTIEDLAVVLDPVLGGVGLVEENIEAKLGLDVSVADTLAQVSNALLETQTLALTVGDSKSEVVTEAAKVTSVARSEAGTLALFPLASLDTVAGVEPQPIVEVIVGSAEARASFDRVTGKSVASFDPAIVTIKVNTPLTNDLGEITGVDVSQFVIGPDLQPSLLPDDVNDTVIASVVTACPDAPNEFCILEGSPLETRITPGSGRTTTNADGSVTAAADGVKIHALKNIGDLPGVEGTELDGGIVLNLAHAEAAAGGKLAHSIAAPAPAPTTPDVPRQLPQPSEHPMTGGTPVLPLAAAAVVALALGVRSALRRANAS